jgi:hypothetical protein
LSDSLSLPFSELFSVTAFGADAPVIQIDTAPGTAVMASVGNKGLNSGIVSAGKSDFGDIEFIFQKTVDDLDHSFDSHGLFCHHHPAFRMGCCQRRLESGPRHGIAGSAVADALSFVHLQNGGQKGIIFTQDQCVVKVL